MSILAIVLHELACEPMHFRETQEGAITNGYYRVNLDGRSFGMGAATYQAIGPDQENLRKSVEMWKKKTRWGRAEPDLDISERPTYDEPLYMKFAFQVRSAHTAYLQHNDSMILALKIGDIVSQMDLGIAKIEQKKKWEAGPK